MITKTEMTPDCFFYLQSGVISVHFWVQTIFVTSLSIGCPFTVGLFVKGVGGYLSLHVSLCRTHTLLFPSLYILTRNTAVFCECLLFSFLHAGRSYLYIGLYLPFLPLV